MFLYILIGIVVYLLIGVLLWRFLEHKVGYPLDIEDIFFAIFLWLFCLVCLVVAFIMYLVDNCIKWLATGKWQKL